MYSHEILLGCILISHRLVNYRVVYIGNPIDRMHCLGRHSRCDTGKIQHACLCFGHHARCCPYHGAGGILDRTLTLFDCSVSTCVIGYVDIELQILD